MAVKFTKRYFSEAERVYDTALGTSKRFSTDEYNQLKSKDPDLALTYSYLHAGLSDKDTSNFDDTYYNMLSAEDKITYLNNEYYTDKTETAVDETTGETFNVYDRTKEYLDYKFQEGVDKAYFESLSGFKKVMSTVGGVLGNAVNALYSTVEGVIDATLLVSSWIANIGDGKVGVDTEAAARIKGWIGEDLTGTRAFGEHLQQFAKRNTYIDKNAVAKTINDVASGLAQMAPLVIPGVGQAIYFTGMAGNTAGQAVYENPDINAWALAGYTLGTTAIEFATEKISGFLFGGSSIDPLFGGKSGTGNGFLRFIKSFASEGFEESVSEFTGVILHDTIVNGDTFKEALGNISIKDVLYAGLIGGIIGGIGTVVEIGTAQNITITKDGTMLTNKEVKQLKAEGKSVEGKKYSKAQSLNLMETLKQAEDIASKTDSNVNKLLKDYETNDKTLLEKEHKEEYDRAVEKDRKIAEKKADAASALAKILDVVGLEGFQKATDLANAVIETRAAEADKYINTLTGKNIQFKSIEERYKAKNPGIGIKITGNIDSARKQLQNFFKFNYGMDVYFADLGWKDGNVDYKSLTLDENTIIIDNTTFNTLSRQALIETVVKEELVHALQFESGVLSPKNMYNLMKIVQELGGKDVIPAELDAAYDADGKVERLAEKQAQALAQTLLFDELTVSKIFSADKPSFANVYKFLNKNKDDLQNKTRNKKETVKYREVLKRMKMYRDAAIKNIGNMEDVQALTTLLGLTEEQARLLSATYDRNFDTAHYSVIKDSYSVNVTKRTLAQEFLLKQRIDLTNNYAIKDPTTMNNALYRGIFDPDRYTKEARDAIFAINPPENMERMSETELREAFKYNLQDYLLTNYNVTANQEMGCLLNSFNLKDALNDDFIDDMRALSVEAPNTIDNYTTLGSIFDEAFLRKFVDVDGKNPLADVQIQITHTESDSRKKAGYNATKKIITLNIPPMDTTSNAVIYDRLLHEVHHALADIQGLPAGTSPERVKGALHNVSDAEILTLAKMLLTNATVEEFKATPTILRDYVAYGVYRITDGEYMAEAYATSSSRWNDYEKRLKGNVAFNRSGFRVYGNGTVLQGYGRFKNYRFESTQLMDIRSKIESKKLLDPKFVVAYAKSHELANFLKSKNITDYLEAGFSEEFEILMGNPNPSKLALEDLVNQTLEYDDGLLESGIGDDNATNIILQYLYGEKTPKIQSIRKVIEPPKGTTTPLLSYAYAYIIQHQNELDVTKPISFDLLKKEMNDLRKNNKTDIIKVNDLLSNDRINREIITKIAKMQFKMTPEKILQLVSDMESGKGFTFVIKDKSLDQTLKEGGEVTTADKVAFQDYLAKEAVDDELVDTERTEINPEELAKRLRTQKRYDTNDLVKQFTTTEKGGAKAADIDFYLNAITQLENRIKSGVNVTEYTEALEQHRDATDFAKRLETQLKDNPSFAVINKIERNKNKLTQIFGEDGWNKIEAALPTITSLSGKEVKMSRRNFDTKINALRKQIHTHETLSDVVKNQLLSVDFSEYEVNELQQYVNELQNTLTSAPKEKLVLKKPEIKNTTPTGASEQTKVAEQKTELVEQKQETPEEKTETVFKDTTIKKATPTGASEQTTVVEEKTKQVVEKKKETTEEKTEKLFKDTIVVYDVNENTEANTLAQKFLNAVAKAPEISNEVQNVTTQQTHAVISTDLLNTMIALGTFINKNNYDTIRRIIASSDNKFAGEALTLFHEVVQNTAFEDSDFTTYVNTIYEKRVSEAGITLSRHAKYVAEYKPVSNLITTLKDQNYQGIVTDEMLEKYDPRLKEKDKMIADLTKQIKDINEQVKQSVKVDEEVVKLQEQLDSVIEELDTKEKQLAEMTVKDRTLQDEVALLTRQINEQKKLINKKSKKVLTDSERQELLAQAKKAAEDKLILEKGNAIEIADWLIRNVEDLEQTSSLVNDMMREVIRTAIKIVEDGGEVGVYKKAPEEIEAFPKAKAFVLKTLKKLKSYRMWAMLSSPVTWVRNFFSNAGMTVLDLETGLFEKMFTKIMDKKGLFADGTQLKYRSTYAGKDAYKLILKKFPNVIESIINGEDVSKYYTQSAEKVGHVKHELLKKEFQEAEGFAKILIGAQIGTHWGLTYGPLGDNAAVTHAILRNVGDLLASNMNIWANRYAAEADTLSKKKNLTQKQKDRLQKINTFIETNSVETLIEIMNKEDLKPIFDNAKTRAFEQYFRNPNKLSDWLTKVGKKHPMLGELISIVFPFPKVATNVLCMAVKYSPIGFAKALVQMNKAKQAIAAGKTTGFEYAEISRTLSQATIGTINLVAGIILAALGAIDIDEDDYMGPSLKIGDFKMSLSELAPAATTLSIGAAMLWAWKNDKSGTKMALDVIYDNTLLGNIENVFRYSSPEQYYQNLKISYISQYIPNCLKLITKLTDWETKDKTGNYWNKLIKTLGSYIPGVSHAVPAKVNPYTGDRQYRSGVEGWYNIAHALLPVTTKITKQSELEKTAKSLGAETTGFSGQFTINSKDYNITNNEKNRLSRYRAEYINDEFEKYVSGKSKIKTQKEDGTYKTVYWNNLTDDEKKKALESLYSKAATVTKIEYWLSHGNGYYTSSIDEYQRLRQQFNNSQQIQYKKNWNTSKFVEK